jgi:two-component system cell cycle sensor histidine kinase/response regulator CckA
VAPGLGPEASESVLQAILDAAREAVVVAEAPDGRVLYFSAAARTLLELGDPPRQDQTLAQLGLADLGAVADMAGLDAPTQVELADRRIRAKDGSTVVIRGSCRRVKATPVDLLILVFDVQPQHDSLEQSDEHSLRLEQIGLLAGGIAHDFNNLLTGILGQASLALATLPPDSPARGPIHKAAGAAGRAADLTRQLLAYAGKGQFQVACVDLNELIIENIGLQETCMPPRVRLGLDLAQDLPSVLADRGQMQQVLMNLVGNAAEAIAAERGGTVRVSTFVRRLEGPAAGEEADRPLPAGDYVGLQVEDNGCGMTPDVLAHIFDPFFSTKGSGRGLGLSATRGIVRAHKGGLVVATAPGEGTRFLVLLPAAASESPAALPAAAAQAQPARGKGTVLVIDDEAAVREVTCDMLAAAGIKAVAAGSGPEGVKRYGDDPAKIALVLLDMQMPGMSGEETLASLRALNPDVKVIVISGFGESEALRRFAGSSTHGFLQKPYDFEALSAAVGRALA